MRIPCKNIEEELRIVYLDNKHLLKKVVAVNKKASICAEDYSAVCSRIDGMLKSLLV